MFEYNTKKNKKIKKVLTLNITYDILSSSSAKSACVYQQFIYN